MKNTSYLLLLLAVFGMSISATAKEQTKTKITHDSLTLNQSSSETRSGSTHRFGLGVATLTSVTLDGNAAALTGFYEIDSVNALQVLFTIPGTSPLQLVGGALLKHTVVGEQGAGFHVGGGFALGSVAIGPATNAFGLSISALAGIHLNVTSSPKVVLHLDGGPTFRVVNSSSNFTVGALSPLLGATIAYMF